MTKIFIRDSIHQDGAVLDVYEVEPTDNQDLANRSNVICSPHMGGSVEAQIGNRSIVAEMLIKFSLYLFVDFLSNDSY